MVIRYRTGTCTFDDFLEVIREDQKADLLEGVIYMASPENTDHNKVIMWLAKVLGTFSEERRLGEVFVNRVAFRLAKDTAPEPDVAFVSTERLHFVQPGGVDGPPDLAVEIVSPDSAQRDYDHKRAVYEHYGVREYWIIDPAERSATFLVREGDRFVASPPLDGWFSSQCLPGLRLNVEWFFERPLPPTRAIVDQMIAGNR